MQLLLIRIYTVRLNHTRSMYWLCTLFATRMVPIIHDTACGWSAVSWQACTAVDQLADLHCVALRYLVRPPWQVCRCKETPMEILNLAQLVLIRVYTVQSRPTLHAATWDKSSVLEIVPPVPEKNIFEGFLPYELHHEETNALFSDLVRHKTKLFSYRRWLEAWNFGFRK